jgi:hypothetical protein
VRAKWKSATGRRLAFTRAVSPEVQAKQARSRKAKPVTVIHADGRKETRSAESFRKGRA